MKGYASRGTGSVTAAESGVNRNLLLILGTHLYSFASQYLWQTRAINADKGSAFFALFSVSLCISDTKISFVPHLFVNAEERK